MEVRANRFIAVDLSCTVVLRKIHQTAPFKLSITTDDNMDITLQAHTHTHVDTWSIVEKLITDHDSLSIQPANQVGI